MQFLLNFSPSGGDVFNLNREVWFPLSLSEPTQSLPWPLIVDRALVLVDEEPSPRSRHKLDAANQLNPLHLHQEVALLALLAAQKGLGERVRELGPNPTKHVQFWLPRSELVHCWFCLVYTYT